MRNWFATGTTCLLLWLGLFACSPSSWIHYCEASAPPGTPIANVQVTLRGKKYDISDVTTVAELQERISEASGVEPSQQGRVLFDGQRLDSKDILSNVGVTEGAQLNLVPGGSKSKKKKSSGAADASSGDAAPVVDVTEIPSSSASNDPSQLAKEMLEQAGIDASQIDEMAKKLGLGGEGGGGMPDMKESLDMMSKMTKSEVFQDYMKDPERLEESRQMILNNPMMKSMMGSMPGMEELLNDKDAFREAMQAAASMYENMDSDELMQAMMGGAAGMPPPNFGADGALPGMPTSPSALDELSEGED